MKRKQKITESALKAHNTALRKRLQKAHDLLRDGLSHLPPTWLEGDSERVTHARRVEAFLRDPSVRVG